MKRGSSGGRPAGRPPELPRFIRAIHGRVGEVVYKTYGRGRDRRFVKTRVPRFDGYVPTAAQRSRRDRMRAATAFAQRIYANPAAKDFYLAAARKLGRQPFRLAVSDYLRGDARLRAPAVAGIAGAERDARTPATRDRSSVTAPQAHAASGADVRPPETSRRTRRARHQPAHARRSPRSGYSAQAQARSRGFSSGMHAASLRSFARVVHALDLTFSVKC